MDAWLSVTRAVHFAAAVALFGQFFFTFVLSPGRTRPCHFDRVVKWSVGVALVSGLAWLALEAASMSGLPFGEALAPATLMTVATKTLFGRVWVARMAVMVVFIIVMVGMHRAGQGQKQAMLERLGFIAALAFLAGLAGMGHAQAGRGGDRIAHLLADAVHLVAAGAWLGALLPLIGSLGDAMRELQGALRERAAFLTQRFSDTGNASIGAIVLTGIVNATYTLPELSALWHSSYGLLLFAKLLLFAAIIGIAAFNRFRLMPRLMAPSNASDATALAAIRRNAVMELVLGVAILAIVGKLGITMPAMDHAMH